MKNSSILAVLAVITIGLFCGCALLPKHNNMTGSWKYTFETSGTNVIRSGTMTIIQESYSLKGRCREGLGQFEISGYIAENGPQFTIIGKRSNFEREFLWVGELSSANQFEGTFTTDKNTSGIFKGTRITAE